jgi:hypothetical protein
MMSKVHHLKLSLIVVIKGPIRPSVKFWIHNRTEILIVPRDHVRFLLSLDRAREKNRQSPSGTLFPRESTQNSDALLRADRLHDTHSVQQLHTSPQPVGALPS